MSLKKNQFIVDCEHCTCSRSDGAGGFVVTVPLRDSSSGLEGTARLRCSITPYRHEIELKQWLDEEQHPIQAAADIEKRLLNLVDHVADKRVCGNRHLCPAEVVRTIAEQKP